MKIECDCGVMVFDMDLPAPGSIEDGVQIGEAVALKFTLRDGREGERIRLECKHCKRAALVIEYKSGKATAHIPKGPEKLLN